jgi:hypothetical protein
MSKTIAECIIMGVVQQAQIQKGVQKIVMVLLVLNLRSLCRKKRLCLCMYIITRHNHQYQQVD